MTWDKQRCFYFNVFVAISASGILPRNTNHTANSGVNLMPSRYQLSRVEDRTSGIYIQVARYAGQLIINKQIISNNKYQKCAIELVQYPLADNISNH